MMRASHELQYGLQLCVKMRIKLVLIQLRISHIQIIKYCVYKNENHVSHSYSHNATSNRGMSSNSYENDIHFVNVAQTRPTEAYPTYALYSIVLSRITKRYLW